MTHHPHDHEDHSDEEDGPTASETGAEVVPLDAARRRARRTDEQETDRDEDEFFDRETIAIEGTVLGPPVDPPDDDLPYRSTNDQRRVPIIPATLRSWKGTRSMLVWAAKDTGYVIGYHAVRSPKYAAKASLYAPVGFFRATGKLLHWATAEEGNWALRQYAADRNDPETWLKLDKQRQRQSRWRWWVVAALAVTGLVGSLVFLLADIPSWGRLLAVGVAVPLLARAGRPTDKPITDRVSEGPRYRKLTAELVRRALLSCGISGINQAVSKDQHAISFPQDIHRDGPGHLAIIDLPFGVEAADVVARRGRLASGMRLPLDQVWPEPGDGHPGRLALWVGYEPASQMKQSSWPLLKDGKVDVFKPFPFATTPRMDTVHASLMFRNWLVGGQPGSGPARRSPPTPNGGRMTDQPTHLRLVNGDAVQAPAQAMPFRTSWTADELMAMTFPEPRWAVPGIIAEGLSLLAGPPKVGKSWLSLGLGIAVASGAKALDAIELEPGPVLYLALEDTARRLQNRMGKILSGQPAPKDLTLATTCPTLPQGGEEAIARWLGRSPNARLVVIDVFAKIRGNTAPGLSAYDADYTAMSRVKRLADTYGVAVVLVHHVRKMASEDFLSEVSGTNGIAGAADATLVLKRARGTADGVLHVTGRDVEEAEYAMAFQPAAGTWHLLDGPPEDHTLSDTRAAIARHVRTNPNSTPKAIADATGLSHDNVRKTCQRMNADGQLCVNATGHYRLPGTEAPGAVPAVPAVPDHATTSTNTHHHEGQATLLAVPAVPADEENHL